MRRALAVSLLLAGCGAADRVNQAGLQRDIKALVAEHGGAGLSCQMESSTRAGWWYVAPRNGHVTIYSRRSLALIASRFKLDFHSYSRSTHFMTRGFSRAEMARIVYPGVLRRRVRDALGIDPLRRLPHGDAPAV